MDVNVSFVLMLWNICCAQGLSLQTCLDRLGMDVEAHSALNSNANVSFVLILNILNANRMKEHKEHYIYTGEYWSWC